MDLKGTRTERNLLASFVGESQARNRYTYFASQAKKDEYIQIQAIFEETADQEKEHAKRFFKFLQGGDVAVEAMFPAGMIRSTEENLRAAAAGEHEEWSQMYPEFARIAREEGFSEIAAVFESVAVAEKQHERRYLGLLANVENHTVFRKGEPATWRCRNCGYVHTGTEAVQLCPACAHPQSYFELLGENW
ncbi:rubrerythrin family protein [Candidatus Bipolaricaulota bacterium]|nr:rubrerythrin family protein [Candidatus Bipolaricaulota bacterium]